jgi:hypothetical protein
MMVEINNLTKAIFCIFLLLSLEGKAQQAPFTGGEGDGYAMVSWGVNTSLKQDLDNQIQLSSQHVVSGEIMKIKSGTPLHQAQIKWVEISGKEVFTQNWESGDSFSLQVPELASGFYLLQIVQAEKMAVRKVQVLGK